MIFAYVAADHVLGLDVNLQFSSQRSDNVRPLTCKHPLILVYKEVKEQFLQQLWLAVFLPGTTALTARVKAYNFKPLIAYSKEAHMVRPEFKEDNGERWKSRLKIVFRLANAEINGASLGRQLLSGDTSRTFIMSSSTWTH